MIGKSTFGKEHSYVFKTNKVIQTVIRNIRNNERVLQGLSCAGTTIPLVSKYRQRGRAMRDYQFNKALFQVLTEVEAEGIQEFNESKWNQIYDLAFKILEK
jgi:hypothetical protein